MKSISLLLLFAGLLTAPIRLSAERIRLTNDHVDLQVVISASGTNLLALVLHNEDQALTLASTNALLIVPESAKLTVPDNIPDLGPAGSDLWVLPASQNPALLNLGVSAEDLDLPAQPLDVFVRRVEGPGQFLAWRIDGADGLRLGVSTLDGLTESDKLTPQVGGHEHHNFGFSTNGPFTVWLQARATVSGTNAWSPETPFLFAVEPVPTLTPFQEWQAEQWPNVIDPTVIGPDSDPDADERSNLLEYAHGLDPRAVDSLAPVRLELKPVQVSIRGNVVVRLARRATDVALSVEAADSLAGPWIALDLESRLDGLDQFVWLNFPDLKDFANSSSRFFRVRASLKP